MSSRPGPGRTRVRRQPKRARYDGETINRVLDRGTIAHVAFTQDGQPYCIPTLYARVAGRLLIHGSTASRLIRALRTGAPACVTVTLLDGLVLARSVFEHSANYESVVLLGSFTPIEGADEKRTALEALTEVLVPGRWPEARAPSGLELRATAVLALAIEEASAKVRTGPPEDDDTPDSALEVWAGVIPVHTAYGRPEPSPGLRGGIPVPVSVRRMLAARPRA